MALTILKVILKFHFPITNYAIHDICFRIVSQFFLEGKELVYFAEFMFSRKSILREYEEYGLSIPEIVDTFSLLNKIVGLLAQYRTVLP